MGEVSNTVLAVLLALTLVVFASGTYLILDKVEVESPVGAVTGVAKVNVTAVVAISLPTSVVDFGDVFQGATKNTTIDSPPPLTIQNDGGVKVNVSIARDSASSALFSGIGGGDNTSSFQFKFAIGAEVGSFNTVTSTTTFTNVPGVTPLANQLNELNFDDSKDIAEVDLLINVPSDEPPGQKNTTLVFTASIS